MRSGFLIPFADQGVTSVANVLVGIILARACGKSEFGLYTLGITVILFGLNFQSSFIWKPFTIYMPRLGREERRTYMGSALVLQAISSSFFTIFIALFAVLFSLRSGNPQLVDLLLVLCVCITPILFREYCRQIYFAKMNFLGALKFDSFVSFCQIFSLISIISIWKLSFSKAFFAIAGCCFIAVSFWIFIYRKEFLFSRAEILKDCSRNWRFGKWIFASTVLWSIQFYAIPWFIGLIRGFDSAGVWAACMGAISIGNPIILATQNSTGPALANVYADQGNFPFLVELKKQMWKVSFIAVPFFLVLALFGNDLVVLMYGSDYSGLGLVLAFLALNAVFSILQIPLTSALFVLDRVRLDFLINIVTLLIFSFAIFPAVQFLGLSGAAAVLSLCSGFALIAKAIFLVSNSGRPPSSKMPGSPD